MAAAPLLALGLLQCYVYHVSTLAEIEARYDSEWVLIGDPEVSPDMQLIRGKVIAHSKSRDEIAQRDAESHLKSAAIIYTGSIPENTAVVL